MARPRTFSIFSGLLAGALVGAVGCFPPDEGRSVPLDRIYFPVGIQVSPGKSWMYVANSDFDLQYNAGSIQVYDLKTLRGMVPRYCNGDFDPMHPDDPLLCPDKLTCDTTGKGTGPKDTSGKPTDGAPTHRCVNPSDRDPCAAPGTQVQSVADQSLTPGLCGAITDIKPLLYGGVAKGTVAIGAFATDLLYATNPLKNGQGSMLLVPVRGDATLHWITVDDDTQYPELNDDGTPMRESDGTVKTSASHSIPGGVELDCGQSGPSNACDDNHRRGKGNNEAAITNPQFSLPAEPFGVALQARRYGGDPGAQGKQFMTQDMTQDDPGAPNDQGAPTDPLDLVAARNAAMTPDMVVQAQKHFVTAQNNLTTAHETLVTTHQTTGEVALFINKWSNDTSEAGNGPELVSVAGGLPSGALAVASVPLPAFWIENQNRVGYLPSYEMTFTNQAQLTLLRTFNDAVSTPSRPFVDSSRSVPITTNASGFESRGVAIDGSARAACEDPVKGPCAVKPPGDGQAMQARAQCLIENCIPIPLDVFVANRSPASLIIGKSPPNVPNTLTDDLPRFYESVPMTTGPSRVFVGNVINRQGMLERRVFVICFDTRRIFIYDPAERRFDAQIVTGRGPHAFALDVKLDGPKDPNAYAYAYVGHFSDSYIGVVDLDQRHSSTYGTIVLSIGQRTPPRASK